MNCASTTISNHDNIIPCQSFNSLSQFNTAIEGNLNNCPQTNNSASNENELPPFIWYVVGGCVLVFVVLAYFAYRYYYKRTLMNAAFNDANRLVLVCVCVFMFGFFVFPHTHTHTYIYSF